MPRDIVVVKRPSPPANLVRIALGDPLQELLL